MITIKIN